MGGDFPRKNANSYFEVVSGEGNTYAEAYEAAVRRVQTNRSIATGDYVEVIDGKVASTTNSLTVKARVEDQYWERVGSVWRVHLLCQVAMHPDSQLQYVRITDSYGMGVRGIIPGAAQFYKGDNTKGIIILASEVLLIAAGVASYMVSDNYYDKAAGTSVMADRKFYNNQYEKWRDISMYSFIGAGAVYVWNIIDAYAVKPKLKRTMVVAAPMYDYRMNCFGIGLTYNF